VQLGNVLVRNMHTGSEDMSTGMTSTGMSDILAGLLGFLGY
jgi:hypothetical protein